MSGKSWISVGKAAFEGGDLSLGYTMLDLRIDGEHLMFTFIPKSTRRSLDQKKVAEALGDTSEYMKETEVAATVRIKEI